MIHRRVHEEWGRAGGWRCRHLRRHHLHVVADLSRVKVRLEADETVDVNQRLLEAHTARGLPPEGGFDEPIFRVPQDLRRHRHVLRPDQNDVGPGHQARDPIHAAIVGRRRISLRDELHTSTRGRPAKRGDTDANQRFARFVDDGAGDRRVSPQANDDVSSPLTGSDHNGPRRATRALRAKLTGEIAGFRCRQPIVAGVEIPKRESSIARRHHAR